MMANNGLYLVDTETHEWILLAKGYTSGWDFCPDCALAEFLEYTDKVSGPRDLTAARGDGKTKFALFTEADLPKECGPHAWKPHR